MRLSPHATDKLVDAIIETYFQLLDKPLHGGIRFLYAWMGAATVLASSYLTGAGLDAVLDNKDNIWAVILVAFVAPLLPAFLIASARTRHGPVRLYISGMMLSSFVVVLVVTLWARAIGTANEAALRGAGVPPSSASIAQTAHGRTP